MPNRKPGDGPISDLMMHGRHPFPAEIEALVLELVGLDRTIFSELGTAPFYWEDGSYHTEAIDLLRTLITVHDNPVKRADAIGKYEAATGKRCRPGRDDV